MLKTPSLILAVLAIAVSPTQAGTARQPNIIWIMPDDLGYGDPGCYGCKDIPTPHIDRIAAAGVRCTRFYAAAPACTPSRACVLSGRYPGAIGMTRVLMGRGGMAAEVLTIAEVLKSAGYTTGLAGKWHLGYGGASLPNPQGFDEFYGFRGGKIDYFKHTDSAQKVPGDPMDKHDFYRNEKEILEGGRKGCEDYRYHWNSDLRGRNGGMRLRGGQYVERRSPPARTDVPGPRRAADRVAHGL